MGQLTLGDIRVVLKSGLKEAEEKKTDRLRKLDKDSFQTESEKQTTFFAYWRAVGQTEIYEKCLLLLEEV